MATACLQRRAMFHFKAVDIMPFLLYMGISSLFSILRAVAHSPTYLHAPPRARLATPAVPRHPLSISMLCTPSTRHARAAAPALLLAAAPARPVMKNIDRRRRGGTPGQGLHAPASFSARARLLT